MQTSHTSITSLRCLPKIKMLLLKAALKKSSYDLQRSIDISLPSNKLFFDGIQLDESSSRAYHQVTGWQLDSDTVHPCYLHTLVFPLHLMLLLQPEFPFPLLGLIHINNQIKQARPIKKGEKLTVSTFFGPLELHVKGWMFSIEVEIYSGSELVWKSISTNLFRTNHGHTVKPTDELPFATFTNPVNARWKLSASLGRQYAKVSGDFNPIHLSKWSAKLLGFKQHIIHGMWTKSYCISRLRQLTPSLFVAGYEVNTTFKQPLYLPSQVNMSVQALGSESINDEQHFKVVGVGDNTEQLPLHLTGFIRSI